MCLLLPIKTDVNSPELMALKMAVLDLPVSAWSDWGVYIGLIGPKVQRSSFLLAFMLSAPLTQLMNLGVEVSLDVIQGIPVLQSKLDRA